MYVYMLVCVCVCVCVRTHMHWVSTRTCVNVCTCDAYVCTVRVGGGAQPAHLDAPHKIRKVASGYTGDRRGAGHHVSLPLRCHVGHHGRGRACTNTKSRCAGDEKVCRG